jgi:hypothetical protein
MIRKVTTCINRSSIYSSAYLYASNAKDVKAYYLLLDIISVGDSEVGQNDLAAAAINLRTPVRFDGIKIA